MEKSAVVGLIMGSETDRSTLQPCAEILSDFKIPFEWKIVSAHRTPELLFDYAQSAQSRGLKIIIAAAGGAAHLPGMTAAKTLLPVIGVPVQSKILNGIDSLLSIVQMPAGVPVATMAIGQAGAKNAALLAISILAINDNNLRFLLSEFRDREKEKVVIANEIH